MINTPKILVSLLLVITALAPNVVCARSSIANVGNWVGTYDGDQIEVAVWFDENPLHEGYVRGYVLGRDGTCYSGLFGFRAMSVGTTFFGTIKDNSLSDYGLELELRYTELNGARSPCTPLKFLTASNKIFFVYEPDKDLAALAIRGEPPQDENRYTNMQRVMSLKKSAPSPAMRKIIAANPPVSNAYGEQSKPSAAEQRVIDNPELDPVAAIPKSEIPCRVLLRDQQVRGFNMGIRGLVSTREPGEKVGVSFQQYAGPVPGGIWPDAFRASEEDRYVQLDAAALANPSQLQLPPSKKGLKFGPEACDQAAMADVFLTSLQSGQAGSATVQMAAAKRAQLPRIEDPEGLYFFDTAGIDQIKHQKMMRVYGTTTLFVPGDFSREGRWSPAQQMMKLRAMVKHSGSNFIEKDLLSPYNEVSFFYDEKLSKEAGDDVWVSAADSRQGKLCTRWDAKHFVDNCAMRSTTEMHKQQRYYITPDLAAAKKIFHRISPDANTLSAEELADPTRNCERGVFCDLPGGTYLNAIYENDFDRIQTLDEQLRGATVAAFDKMLPGDGLSETERKVYRRSNKPDVGAVIKNLLVAATVPTSSLPYLAKRYMYQYQSTSQACFEPGHRVIKKEWIIPATQEPDTEYNGFIIPGDIRPGSTITASYNINPEFFALCERVCDAVRPTGRSFYLTTQERTMSNGLDKVLTGNDCASAEVQQFERNLIQLTNRVMNTGARKRYVERSSL